MSNLVRHRLGCWMRSGYLGKQDSDVILDVLVHGCYRLDAIGPLERPVVVDIGAHCGYASLAMRRQWPEGRFACVEANPDNWECLRANVDPWAMVVPAAVCNARRPVLLNSIAPGGTATGSSRVVDEQDVGHVGTFGHRVYRADGRTVDRLSFSGLLSLLQVDHVDLLKIDCEGCEHDVLRDPAVRQCARIVGEWHGAQAWAETIEAMLNHGPWEIQQVGSGGDDLGVFTARRI